MACEQLVQCGYIARPKVVWGDCGVLISVDLVWGFNKGRCVTGSPGTAIHRPHVCTYAVCNHTNIEAIRSARLIMMVSSSCQISACAAVAKRPLGNGERRMCRFEVCQRELLMRVSSLLQLAASSASAYAPQQPAADR